jgi:hypothetical protein
MQIEKNNSTGGLYFKLSKIDFSADWKGFLKEIKRLQTACYNVPEKDDENWWYVGKPDLKQFYELKKIHIDKLIEDREADNAAGFKPLPRAHRGRII